MWKKALILVFATALTAGAGASDDHGKSQMNLHTNRLIDELSPYLLQHAHNPVDWYPWGEEAFEKARNEDKPIFLSIGYATCHWCHVMEHESFENEEIAALLNKAFVCIKVDREERPDIDSIYMTVCQMMNGQGGWPLTIIMTPDKKPFYAATYIPPDTRFGRLGMRQLVPRVSEMWKSQREDVLESAGQITQVLATQAVNSVAGRLDAHVLQHGYRALMAEYDSKNGGFGDRPKFPTPHRLVFLLRSGREECIAAAEHTLVEMRMGGIFDQIGFGFHRYSTDEKWLVPHFEKMLYDQALLAIAYTEAYELNRKPLYRQVVQEILTYVLRDMTSHEGGFYSAEDADSEGEEGLFYIWDSKEVEAMLGSDYGFAAKMWNFSAGGNFHDEATGRSTGKNIPYLSEIPGKDDGERIAAMRKKLFDARENRIHPLKDTKILADWNGLMIAAFAKAGHAFEMPEYIEAAAAANRFIASSMTTPQGRLLHRYRDGRTAVAGQLDDYAFMVYGLLELYEATFNLDYLETALRYGDILESSFADEENGGYFMTADDAETLIVRPKNLYDGAIPSGNSMQMYNLLRLARLTGRFQLEQEAGDVGNVFGGVIQRAPSGFAQTLIAIQFGAERTVEIVVVGKRDSDETKAILEYIHSVYKPGKVVFLKEPAQRDRSTTLAPFTRDLGMRDGRTTVYICRNFICEQPITSLSELKKHFK